MSRMKAFAILLGMTTPAAAQVSDVEVPVIVVDTVEQSAGEAPDEALDLANIVQSAAKGLTTVQEAPAIVTVITDDEIRDRQFQGLLNVIDTVPGWARLGAFYGLFQLPVVRGQAQAVQYLHDGVSLFDPMVNVPGTGRQQPMEVIKRVELITGPGGVLWGSNSLLGILNVITKDAEDIEGVEVGSAIGHGSGDRLMARAYVMAGKSDLRDGKVKAFGHASVETYQGAEMKMPTLLFHQPLPQPNSENTYGPLTASDQPTTTIFNLLGKVTLGKLQLRGQYQFGSMKRPMGLSGNPVVKELPEDSRMDCPADGPVSRTCIDNLRASRDNAWDNLDRYVVAEYRDRFANGKAGLALRGYGQQFSRGLKPLGVLSPSDVIQGGLNFQNDMTSYRVGGAFDGDLEVAKPVRVLYGAEAFSEWIGDTRGGSRQGAGLPSTFNSPYDLARLPLPCPRIYDPERMTIVPVPGCPLTFAFATTRSVMGAYINPQLKPTKKLILDGGARVQVAPEQLGDIGYPLNLTASGTLVYNFLPAWHIKLNYAQGFRPPAYNNTSPNGEAVSVGGRPDLEVETSEAMQAEINARIFKGERRIRELSFRVDGSYTRLNNLINIVEGTYTNTGDRAIASAEFLGKLYIQGGHRLELAYTWMRVSTADTGLFRSLPNNYFNLSTVFNLVNNKLTGTTNLKVAGATEDPNRLVEYRDARYNEMGYPSGTITTEPTDLVHDRLPPVAELSLGLGWTPTEKLLVRATVHNALMQHAYQIDNFMSYEPHAEYLPNPYEGIRAYVSAQYQY